MDFALATEWNINLLGFDIAYAIHTDRNFAICHVWESLTSVLFFCNRNKEIVADLCEKVKKNEMWVFLKKNQSKRRKNECKKFHIEIWYRTSNEAKKRRNWNFSLWKMHLILSLAHCCTEICAVLCHLPSDGEEKKENERGRECSMGAAGDMELHRLFVCRF